MIQHAQLALPLTPPPQPDIKTEDLRRAYDESAFKRHGYPFERALEIQSFNSLLHLRAQMYLKVSRGIAR